MADISSKKKLRIPARADSARSLHSTASWTARLTKAHERQPVVDRAGSRQCLASQTAEEREASLHHGGELVESSVLHRRRYYTARDTQKLTKELESVEKFALKICSHRWDLSYFDLIENFNLPTLSSRREYLRILALYKIVTVHIYFPPAVLKCIKKY